MESCLKRIFTFALCFSFFLLPLFSAENTAYLSPYPQNFTQHTLSALAEISLITFDSGDSLFRAFGHSSIRVSDPVKNIDKLFTFGAIENIDSPSEQLSLLYKRKKCKAGAARFLDVLKYDNEKQNRLVIEQKLNISREDKEKIYSYLLWKTQELNVIDDYDLTKNNCATTSRDVIKLAWSTALSENRFLYDSAAPLSYRSLIVSKLSSRPWAALAADFFLGSAADRHATIYDITFMPDILRSVVSVAKIKSNGETLPLIKSTSVIYTPIEKKSKLSASPRTPELVFMLLAALAMCMTLLQPSLYLLSLKNEKAITAQRIAKSLMQSFDILFFFLTGLLGLFCLLLSIFGKSKITAGNINFIWLLPTNIIFAFSCYKEKNRAIISGYFLALAYLSLFTFIFREKFIQHINPAFSSIMLITISRSLFQALSRPLKAMLQATALSRNTSAQNRLYTTGQKPLRSPLQNP